MSEYLTPALFSACPSRRAAFLRRRNHASPASSAKATRPPTTPPAIAPAFDGFDVLVSTAGKAAVVAVAANCDDDDVAAAFVDFAVDELDREVDGAAAGFAFFASPLTRKTPLPFEQQLSAAVPFPQQ